MNVPACILCRNYASLILLLCVLTAPVLAKKNNSIGFAIPTVKIAASTEALCKGATISFTATATNAGPSPTYQWKVNGQIIQGANLNIYSTANLFTGDYVQCLLTADPAYPGLETNIAMSNIITVKVFNDENPSVTIATTLNDFCPGTAVQLISYPLRAGQNPIFDWKVNGQSIGHEPTLVYNGFKNNDEVACYMIADNPCNTFPIVSNTIKIKAKEIPLVHIQPGDTLVAAGSQLALQPEISSPYSSYQWQPQEWLNNPSALRPETKPLLNAVDFLLTVKTTEGCTATAQAHVKVYRKLFMPNAFSPNKDGINDIFRIPPDVTLLLDEFAVYDRNGNKLFSTTDITKGWDGMYNGNEKEQGIYIYVIRGILEQKPVIIKNSFLLLR